MKRSVLLVSALLITAIAGAGWLWMENARLRSELELADLKTDSRLRTPERAMTGSSKRENPVKGGARPGNVLPKPRASDRTGGGEPVARGLLIADNEDGTFTVTDPGGTWSKIMTPEELRDFRQKMNTAMAAAGTKLPGGPSWSPGRAAGPPDTPQHGDHVTAWASQSPDAGPEWLQLKYPKSVEIREINIHESYNPGALSKVSAIMPDGSEKVIWQGTENPEEGVIERAVKVPPGIRSDQIRIELDTSRVPGWNEIDAVEVVGVDGSKQWASESTASSYFGQGRGEGLSNGLLQLDSMEYEGFTR